MTALRPLLRQWRAMRHVSQHGLALRASISQRHLSFVESGRAQPSREMVLRIADALDLPLRARNELLGAAGFAAVYPERTLDDATLHGAREALQRILTHHEPYPAMVLDRWWNIVMRNDANARIVTRCVDAAAQAALSSGGRLNFMRLMFAPTGMRPHIHGWEQTGSALLTRLRREAAATPGSPSDDLLRELLPLAPAAFVAGLDDAPLPPLAPLEIVVGGDRLRLFNSMTTFGTPQDVTLQELRVEMSFPVDSASDSLLRRLSGTPRASL